MLAENLFMLADTSRECFILADASREFVYISRH